MESTDDNQSAFNLSRDSIYGAVILLGVGVGMTWVTSMAMVANLVGRYTVSHIIPALIVWLAQGSWQYH